MKRLARHLGARWRSFIREADATRRSSTEIWRLITAHRAGGDPIAGVPRLDWPVPGRVTSPFEMRHGRLHEGIDLSAPRGASVHPALGGTVLHTGEFPGYGNVVVIVHGASLATVYAHLETIEVAAEDRVGRECRLGTAGSTGRSFGCHVHFEVRFDGTPVDPLVFLQQ